MRRKFFILCAIAAVTVLFAATHILNQSLTAYNATTVADNVRIKIGFLYVTDKARTCPDVFPGMLHGHWVPRKNVTSRELLEMDRYLQVLRAEYNIPDSLQRDDGACGNVGYDGVSAAKFMWFRALCDPNGSTPCCFDFQCVNKSIAECNCPRCVDPRTPVHAELSHWRPALPWCPVRHFVAKEACDLLKDTTLVMAGDSFVRHMFVALVMMLTENLEDGALKKDADPNVRRQCTGMYQINGLKCRALLDQNRTLCGGKVRVVYLEIFSIWKGHFLLPFVQSLTSMGQRVLLVTGVGIHDNFFHHIIWAGFLQPLVDYVAPTGGNGSYNATGTIVAPRRRWPKLVWAGTHAPNVLKSPYISPAQSYEGVRFYNREMSNRLSLYGIPVLDTFNMTAPLHSVDGTHYGFGANLLKVQFLLNWVQERQTRKEW